MTDSLAPPVGSVGEAAAEQRNMELLTVVRYGEDYLDVWVERGLSQTLPVLARLKAHLVHRWSESFAGDESWAAPIIISSPCGEKVPE